MMTATIEFSLDELKELRGVVKGKMLDLIEMEIEKLELIDMSDWNDCGDACKL